MALNPFSRRAGHAVVPLSPRDAAALARLHVADFSRAWSAEEFETLLSQPVNFGFKAIAPGANSPDGFVLARLAADEGEILTIVVARAARGRGLGRALMDAVLRVLHAQRAESLFLEVDEANGPALALYRRLGFREVGRREGYYKSEDGARTGALVMRRDLR